MYISKGLKPIVELLSNKNDEANRVSAIVKRNSKFRNYEDLKGSKACFTSYQSLGLQKKKSFNS